MKIRDQFRTGWRNLRRQKLRTALTVFAIVIGAVSVTVMLSLVTSAKGFLTSSFEKTGEDRRVIVTPVTGYSYGEARWQTWTDGSGKRIDDAEVAALAAIPNVRSVTPIAGVQMFEGLRSATVEAPLKNTFAVAYQPNGTVTRELVAGRSLEDGDVNGGVLISRSLAEKLGHAADPEAVLGTTVTMVPRKDMGDGVREIAVTIVGVMFAEGDAFDMTLDYYRSIEPRWERCEGGGPDTRPTCTSESELARNGYAAVYVSMNSRGDSAAAVDAVRALGFGAAAATEELDAQNTAFTIIGAVLGGIGGIALFVAAIGVINTMVMATLERTREIGIMRAIGATKRTVRRLFTVEAAVLGFMGGVVGVAMSLGVAALLNNLLNQQLAESGISERNVVVVPPQIALVVIAVTTLIGMLAGRLPARRAANLDPVEALRYE